MEMKILMLNSLTEQSGSGVRFWSIAKELSRRGHSVFFLERSVTRNGRKKSAGIRYRSSVDSGIQWLDILRATWLNLFHGLTYRPHWVFVLKPMPNVCLPALLLKIIFKSKAIVDIDDLDFAYYPDGLRRFLVRFFFKLFPRHFDMVTTHNEHLRDFIMVELGISPEKIYFLPQGIETRKFLEAQPDEGYGKKLGLGPTEKVIVYCASLGITSDFQQVLPMLVDFLKTCDDVKVLIIGDGARKQSYARKVEAYDLQERIIFTDYVPHDDMPAVLRLAVVGINYMALTEANTYRASIKVREYLAAGLKVVCNPAGDAEIFRDYVTVCNSIEDFPGAMRSALDMGAPNRIKAAQRFVETRYSWPSIVRDFLTYLGDTSAQYESERSHTGI